MEVWSGREDELWWTMQIGWIYVDELRRGIAIGHCLRHDSRDLCVSERIERLLLAESLLIRLAIAKCGE